MGKQNLKDIWDNKLIKPISIFIVGVLEVKERENGAQRPSEDIIAEKFTNLMKAQEVLSELQENELRKIGT